MPTEPKRLDIFLPVYDFGERHSVRIEAPGERVLAAVKSVRPEEAPLLRRLFRLRGLPTARGRPVFDQMLALGFVVLAEEPGRELVLGLVGRPWRLRGALRPVDDFAGFADPGYAKMALDFRYDGAVLSTETRVLATDRAARRKLAAYWLLVRPGSGAIRRSWLRAVSRRAGSSS